MTRRWLWLLLLVPILIGLARLRFDVEVLDLLPPNLPTVQGLKLYQQYFANARELLITIKAPDPEQAESAAHMITDRLREQTNLVANAFWEPPWLEHPGQSAELLAYLWLNQSPAAFEELEQRLSPEKLPSSLAETRESLATSMSPADIARSSYDPYGFTRLPESATSAAPSFGQGQELFASPDGTFRIIFVQANRDLTTYRECDSWLKEIRAHVSDAVGYGHGFSLSPASGESAGARGNSSANNAAAPNQSLSIGYTGRPAFVAEIATGMERDITISVGGTSVIIAILFWLAHRRWKPMLWLLTLLALILGSTLALGGLIFGTISVISMGFAAILLGLAVDYAVVHYQEALAHPSFTIPQIRHAIAPSIFWAATTSICAFLVLNFGGLPGLAQLGSLVGIGIALSACVMIFAFLPPLFRERMKPRSSTTAATAVGLPNGSNGDNRAENPPLPTGEGRPARRSAFDEGGGEGAGALVARFSSFVKPNFAKLVFITTAVLLLAPLSILLSGLPHMDPTANALHPRNSASYAALEQVKEHLNQNRDPLWIIVSGNTETEVARRLEEVQPTLNRAVSNSLIADFKLPTPLWPRPKLQPANRATARTLVGRRATLREAAVANGFAAHSLGLTDEILNVWQRAVETPGVFWPTNTMSQWIFSKVIARSPTNFFALGFINPSTNRVPGSAAASLAKLESQLPHDGVLLSGWELLGTGIFSSVKENMWKLILPMIGLILLSLGLAFRRPQEVLLSLAVLTLSGVCLLAVMRLAGWSWNLLNLMALPLILGTGVDYSIFMQLALRRYQGDLSMAYRSVGRALLLCGATAIAGFGSLAWSSNAGMASLGLICAIGIAGNMLISVLLLPFWWQSLIQSSSASASASSSSSPSIPLSASETAPRFHASSAPHSDALPTRPSLLYCSPLWRLGLNLVRLLPENLCAGLSRSIAHWYVKLAPHRREVVVQNLLPVLRDPVAVERSTQKLFEQFALKLVDLWRFEAGLPIDQMFGEYTGWQHFLDARAQKRGILLVTAHLGNWEFGAPALGTQGVRVHVVTLAEPGRNFTRLRLQSRARRDIETIVIGNDPFVFVDIIRRLEAGACVALLVDRPSPSTSVTVELFGRPFAASIAAAELARASGCIVLPVYMLKTARGYSGNVLPPVPYERARLRDRDVRQQLTQQIMSAFEPIIRQHPDQWFHFVPMWTNGKSQPPNSKLQ